MHYGNMRCGCGTTQFFDIYVRTEKGQSQNPINDKYHCRWNGLSFYEVHESIIEVKGTFIRYQSLQEADKNTEGHGNDLMMNDFFSAVNLSVKTEFSTHLNT